MKQIKGRGGQTRGKGLTVSVRSMWLECLSESSDIYAAMSELTGLRSSVNDQRVEMRPSRTHRDWSDMSTLTAYVSNNCPFRFSDNSRLISLSLGVVASPDDKVSCDCAEEIGWDIHKQLDSRKFTLAKLHKT